MKCNKYKQQNLNSKYADLDNVKILKKSPGEYDNAQCAM